MIDLAPAHRTAQAQQTAHALHHRPLDEPDRRPYELLVAGLLVALASACGGGGGSSTSIDSGAMDAEGPVRPIASQRLVAGDHERPFFAGRWSDGGLVTLGTAANGARGAEGTSSGLVALHHGSAGEVDWCVHLGSVWTPAGFAGIGAGQAWIAARRSGTALLARVQADGTIGGQFEIQDLDDSQIAQATVIVDGLSNAYLVTDHAVVRVQNTGEPLWAFQIQPPSGRSELWVRPDSHGGVVAGTRSAPLRSSSISAAGVVRWSQELAVPAGHEASVLDVQVDDVHGTTLLVQETATGAVGNELVVVRIAANGATSAQALRTEFAAFASAELIEYAPVDEGRGGWVLLLQSTLSSSVRAYDAVSVDPHGAIAWSRRIERDTSSLLGASLVAFHGGGAAVRFLYAITPYVRIARFDSSGSVLWKRGLGSNAALVDDGGQATNTTPFVRSRDRADARFDGDPSVEEAGARDSVGAEPPNPDGADAAVGLGLVLALARADNGMFLPTYVPGVGLAVCSIDAAGNLEWAARIAASGSLTKSVTGPDNTGFLRGVSGGVPFLVHLDWAVSGRWKLNGLDASTFATTTDHGAILAQAAGAGADEDIAWLSIRRNGTSDAVCAPRPTALGSWTPTVEDIELELAPLVLGTTSDVHSRSFALSRAAISSRVSLDVRSEQALTVPFDACVAEVR